MLLLTGIIVYFFSQRTGWVLFAIYGSYLAFDNLIAFFYALQGEIRGDYLYDPVYTWLHYLGLYFLFSGLAIAALYFMYRFLEYQFNFQKKNWVFILSAGLVLALVYTYLFAEAWAHPN
ncbi:MAG: hypothetical protein A3D31_08035 [Candidatus Fluviicola riflensis]|nr:MAG: hypothetical protein CHH17_06975 [Candidatus Fluviicola riflensis]OGS79890.1 MAG: hypothetical protein A3D31_08035 [Candidatus Fluviicola riflensis]OGS82405.1 MAG: hypothetical protein A2724_16980 [Fluviicola sp. RIFCSPHIGHO2_01_FULL_43_53]OGS88069.1 MAG: hypothetical protein A3E30_14415 [Fluviicola sp. RIFCSPHIGHO2_12_FULL_43_24]